MKAMDDTYIRSIIFGFEDGLVSTTGAVVGISIGAADKSIVILAGFVLIAVEALSMGAGQYLSERTVQQNQKSIQNKRAVLSSIVMYLAYFLAGLVPILPIIFFELPESILVAITAAFIGLFALGFIKGKVVAVPPFRSGLEILFIGGIATIIGSLVGLLLKV